MKRITIIVGLMLLGLARTALAVEPAELENRIHLLTDRFSEFQQQPGKAIPPETLRRAQGIVLLDRTKAGFLFAYQGGNGVAMVKDAQTGAWGPVAFLNADEASLGFQVGSEQHFYIMLLMNTNATRLLLDQKFEFRGEARGTAGNDSTGVETGVTPEPSVLVYDDRQGLYAGAAVKGGAISPDNEANRVYYNQYLTMKEILFDHRVQPSVAAANLANTIQTYANSRQVSSTASR